MNILKCKKSCKEHCGSWLQTLRCWNLAWRDFHFWQCQIHGERYFISWAQILVGLILSCTFGLVFFQIFYKLPTWSYLLFFAAITFLGKGLYYLPLLMIPAKKAVGQPKKTAHRRWVAYVQVFVSGFLAAGVFSSIVFESIPFSRARIMADLIVLYFVFSWAFYIKRNEEDDGKEPICRKCAKDANLILWPLSNHPWHTVCINCGQIYVPSLLQNAITFLLQVVVLLLTFCFILFERRFPLLMEVPFFWASLHVLEIVCSFSPAKVLERPCSKPYRYKIQQIVLYILSLLVASGIAFFITLR